MNDDMLNELEDESIKHSYLLYDFFELNKIDPPKAFMLMFGMISKIAIKGDCGKELFLELAGKFYDANK